ncbi:MAG: hypothetical protein HOD92_23890 [Deltaproteobacteria bacterium]|jgi:hypothetical protein|nr:hypothetical protein [Deltaproteobacteria bacterium]MBT4527565.1 hypothetical protein [Deltaproteobacteria bacterium]
MFAYSCSEALLVNWILGQINTHPDAIFPHRKGWKGHLTLFYPTADGISYFLMSITNNKETIYFLPVDVTIKESHLKQFQLEKILKFIQKKNQFTSTLCQIILMTCEQEKKKIEELIKKNRIQAGLLVLYSDKIEFQRGCFNNEVLNYRLSKLTVDPDLIAQTIPDNFQKVHNNKANILFYQNLFHVLNKYWIQNQNNILLEKAIAQSILYWKQYKKKQRKKIIERVQNTLLQDLNSELSGIIRMISHKKKSESHPVFILQFILDAKDKKNITTWIKKQNRVLGLIRHKSLQITPDIYSIISSQKSDNL